ncbi:MAG: hypothetical protein WDN50_11530 [Bradyrhizobium sp.]
MSDAKGATGAGTYPSLAGNSNLVSSGYPVGIVRQRTARHAGLWRGDERRSGRRRGELRTDAFRQFLSGCGDNRGCPGGSPVKTGGMPCPASWPAHMLAVSIY